MLILMAWTAAQKAHGRAELLRRQNHETAATYRKRCLKAAGLCVLCLCVVVLGLWDFPLAHGIRLVESICLMCLAAAGAYLTGTVAYVRGLDWRRRPASE